MAYKITDSCLKCGTCAGECPMNAISEGEDQYVIDADTCVGCGTCADACPVQAILEEEEDPPRLQPAYGGVLPPFAPLKLVRNCVKLFTEPACAVLRRPVFNR